MAILKRFAAPKFWHIEKKTKKFVISPMSGPHAKLSCIPAGILVRDVLGHARNMNEIRAILRSGAFKVDGRIRREPGFPVGLMDVVTVGNEHYRILPGRKGLTLAKINSNEAGIKLCRIENKKYTAKKIQLNLHDGRNVLIEKDNYATGDTLVIELGKGAIRDVIKMKKGSAGLIISGKNAGRSGRIEGITITRSPQPNRIVMSIGGEAYEIAKDYVIVVGDEKPVINLPEEGKSYSV